MISAKVFNGRLMVVSLSLAMMMASLPVQAKTIRPLGGSFTDWSSPDCYVEKKAPEAGDDCRLDRADNKTYTVSDTNPASMAACLNMKHIRVFGTNVTLVVDVQSTCVTANWEHVYQDGSNASTRGVKYGGRLVKTGPGELVFANTSYVDGYNVLLNCDVEVREGRISVPQVGKLVRCDGYVTISNGASFVMANADTYVGGLRGDGEFLCPTTSETKCFVTGKDSVFGGKVGAKVRFDTSSSGGVQYFTGTENLSQYNQVEGGGVLGGVDFGDVPDPDTSSLGTDELRFFRYGTFRNIATEPKTTGRNFALQGMTDGIGFLDSGDYGGWTVTSKVFFARAIGDSLNEYWRMQRLGFKGDNTNESVFSGVIPMRTLGGTNYTMHITKDGTGTWKFLENRDSVPHGAFSVKNGTLRFNTLAEKGQQCALGSATILYEDYFGLRNPSKAVDWAWKLGSEETCGEMEYVGEKDAWTGGRAAVVDAGGGKLSSSGTGTLFGLLGGVKPLGEAETTLTIGGTSTGTNEIGRLADGAGKLSLVKEDAGTWTLDGGNDFSGKLQVKEGTLRVRDTTKYSWFRWTIRERGKDPNTQTDGIYVRELGIYDADNKRINGGLRCWTNYVVTVTNGLPPGKCAYLRTDVNDNKSGDTPSLSPIDAMFDDGVSIGAGVFGLQAWIGTGKLVRESDPATWIPTMMHLPYGAKPAASFDVVRWHGGNYQRTFRVHSMEGSVDGLHWDLLTNVVHQYNVDYPRSSTYGQEGWAISRTVYAAGDAAVHAGGAKIAGRPANPVGALDKVSRVRVDAGATLEGETTAVEIKGLEIDESGAGTIRNCSFAASGVIDVVSHQKGFSGDLGLVFESCEGLENLNGWTLLLNGQAKSGWTVSFSDGKLRLYKPGIIVIVK